MDTPWQFDPAELDDVLSSKGHNALLGQRYHAHGEAWIELAMPWDARLTDDDANGILARGPIMTLLDNGAGVSVWLRRGGYLPQVTLDLRADWIRPAAAGAGLVCRCECISMTATVGFARGVAYDLSPDDPVCLVSAAFALL